MAYADVTEPADGVKVTWSLPFKFIDRAYVKVEVIDSEGVVTHPTFTFVDDSTVQILPAVANGSKVRRYRSTKLDAPLVDFRNAAVLTEADLDKQALQGIDLAQELDDRMATVDRHVSAVDVAAAEAVASAKDAQSEVASSAAAAAAAQASANTAQIAAAAAKNTADAALVEIHKANEVLGPAVSAVETANAAIAAFTPRVETVETQAAAAVSTANGVDAKATSALTKATAAEHAASVAADAVATAVLKTPAGAAKQTIVGPVEVQATAGEATLAVEVAKVGAVADVVDVIARTGAGAKTFTASFANKVVQLLTDAYRTAFAGVSCAIHFGRTGYLSNWVDTSGGHGAVSAVNGAIGTVSGNAAWLSPDPTLHTVVSEQRVSTSEATYRVYLGKPSASTIPLGMALSLGRTGWRIGMDPAASTAIGATYTGHVEGTSQQLFLTTGSGAFMTIGTSGTYTKAPVDVLEMNLHCNRHQFKYGGINDSLRVRIDDTDIALAEGQAGWHGASDIKFKKDVVPLERGLDCVLAMQPVEFTWKRDDVRNLGFIAQDIRKLIPESVIEQPDGQDGGTALYVDKHQVTPVLVKAVQELEAMVRELQAEVKALKETKE